MFPPLLQLVRRRLPAALCLLAVTMQVSVPALHGPHASSVRPEVAAAGGATVLVAPDQAPGDARHDAESCSQCRLVSQLQSFTPLSVVAAAPAIEAGWLASTPASGLRSHAALDSSAPRAPPLLA